MKPTLPQYAVPRDGFLKDYLDYAEPMTDAPREYHLFTAMTVIGVTLGNRVYHQHGNSQIYPNLWVALLGPSSFFRKTTSIGIGRDLLEKFEDNAILPDEFSPERLFKKLEDNPVGLLTWSEFGHALSTFERSYMVGTKEFLTDIYDCRPRYKRELNSQSFEITDPALSILTASTPDWLKRRMREDDIRAGFYPRFLFVPAFQKKASMALPPPRDHHKQSQLVLQLGELKKLAGQVDLSRVADGYTDFYRELDAEILGLDDAEMLGGFYARLTTYCLKFAMIYAASSGTGTFIDTDAMSRAIHLTRYLTQCVRYLYSHELALTPEMQLKKKVHDLIRKHPGIQHSRLLSLSHAKARDLKEALDTLRQEELIETKMQKKKAYHFPIDSSAELARSSQGHEVAERPVDTGPDEDISQSSQVSSEIQP